MSEAKLENWITKEEKPVTVSSGSDDSFKCRHPEVYAEACRLSELTTKNLEEN